MLTRTNESNIDWGTVILRAQPFMREAKKATDWAPIYFGKATDYSGMATDYGSVGEKLGGSLC